MSSYVDHRGPGGSVAHSWEAHTRAALLWQYGPERAASILAGKDEATNADINKWRTIAVDSSENILGTSMDLPALRVSLVP